MFLDASAIIAMLGDEKEGDAFADALAADPVRLASPLSVWESVAGLAREYALSVPEARRKVAEFLSAAKVRVVPMADEELEFALDAYDQFGKAAIRRASTWAIASPTPPPKPTALHCCTKTKGSG